MITPDPLTVLDCVVLFQLGGRLRGRRIAIGLSAVELALRAGMSRETLAAVEFGDPSTSIGSYLRVMAALGLSGELSSVATDTLLPGRSRAKTARSRRTTQIVISLDETCHYAQDQQSLALHRQAVRAVQHDSALLDRSKRTLDCWLASTPSSRSAPLWREWEQVLNIRSWRKVLRPGQRSQQLRQASSLVTVLPEAIRLHVLTQVRDLKTVEATFIASIT